jgi:ATP-dependent protease ClpP protease subunit
MEDITTRVITLDGMIECFGDFNDDMTVLELLSDDDIEIAICSEGGGLYDGLAVAGRIVSSPCTVISTVYGCAMSSAVLPAVVADHRRISKFAYLMLHEPSMSMDKTKLSAIRDYVSQAYLEEDRYYTWLSEYSNRTKDYWIKRIGKKDIYLTPEEAVDLGLMDEII